MKRFQAVHQWLLEKCFQKLVDFLARQGVALFKAVEILFVIHVVIFTVVMADQNLLVLGWGMFVAVQYIRWNIDMKTIKQNHVNPRRYNEGLSIIGLLGALGAVSYCLAPFDLGEFLKYGSFFVLIFISQCNYIEPQLRQKKQAQKEVFT